MKKPKIYLITILTVMAGFSFSYAQEEGESLLNTPKYFYLDPLVFYGKDSVNARLDLYVEFPMANLNFKKNQVENTFEVSIDYTIIIVNSKKDVIINKTFTELIKNTQKEQKNISTSSDYIIKQFWLPPDNYEMEFLFRDRNSFDEHSQLLNILVKDFRYKEIIFSDIMIVSDYKEDDNGKKTITPLVNNNIGNLKEFYLFFEVNNLGELPATGEYKLVITGDNNKTITETTLSYVMQTGENKKIERIPTDNFTMGNYKLEIINQKNNEVVSSKKFIFRWGELPVSVKDLNTAIDQLVYIATENELDNVKSGKTNAEREQRFIKFWKDKDPTPKTPRNEIMLEYYGRVKFANDKFKTTYREGWKTDMGMVYIIYGEPGNIDRSVNNEFDKPYEIWSYYDINKQFVFIDDTGFGDYRLLTPIYDKQATRMRF